MASTIDDSEQVEQARIGNGAKTRLALVWNKRREWIIACALALVAFVPRMLLAIRLDVFTDEPIYIIAANWYYLLARQLNFTSQWWTYNNEHPAFAKLLMAVSIHVSQSLFHVSDQLIPARLPSVLLGTLVVVAVYMLGRAPFGRWVALLAALCLAFSPWFAYFNAEALLDTTMTALVTLAFLILWHAIAHPRLYLLWGVLVGLAGASKYPAALAVPGMFLFTAYYFCTLNPRLPARQRQPLPWRLWLFALLLIPVTFFLADPPIWANPVSHLLASLNFSLFHAEAGHVSFWAGQVYTHVPPWMILYILAAKISVFVTLSAALFLVYAAVRLARFHIASFRQGRANRQRAAASTEQDVQDGQRVGPQPDIPALASLAFLFIWLASFLLMFSQLTILVGTHYYLPVAPPLALAGACGLAILLRYRTVPTLRSSSVALRVLTEDKPASALHPLRQHSRADVNWRSLAVLAVMAALLLGSHLYGLITVYAAEGYTSELFRGENSTLEVVYTGYREADTWLLAHTKIAGTVGIVGGSATPLWYIANPHREGKLRFVVVQYGSRNFPFDYLVWPMHLVQRHYSIPSLWRSHIVHTITGGGTTYCFIMARDPSTLTS